MQDSSSLSTPTHYDSASFIGHPVAPLIEWRVVFDHLSGKLAQAVDAQLRVWPALRGGQAVEELDCYWRLADELRAPEKALGTVSDAIGKHEAKSRVFRRSLFAVAEIKAGEVLTGHNVRSIRPANGLPPKHLERILGRRAARDLPAGTPLSWEGIAGSDSVEEVTPPTPSRRGTQQPLKKG